MNYMKKALFASMVIIAGISTSCIKEVQVKTTSDFMLQSTIGIRKDIGTAD